MSTEVIVGIAVVAAMPVIFLAVFTWSTHKKLRETEKHFARGS